MKSPTNRPFEEITAIPLFNRMDRMDVRRLVDVARQKQVQAGEFFFFQGDAAESMYILLQGRVKLHRQGRTEKKHSFV